ncbi:MAG: B12-binding domain-containing radical SAM protein [Nitrospirae bacterium]|nr:B12-binding domain-containing radical SAM protein [Nitrospirota bacterium]
MPIGLAYLAGYLRSQNHDIQVIDAFGDAPDQVRSSGKYYIQGLTPDQVTEKIPSDIQVVGFYAHLTVTHNILLEIIDSIKKRFPHCATIVLENINKVNSYSLRQVYKDFFAHGIDYVVLGYLEHRTQRLLESVRNGASVHDQDGVITKANCDKIVPPRDFTKDANLDDLPFPAWDLLPLQNYWRLGYAHGPLASDKYLPLLSSRGCAYNCGFCIMPEVSDRKWQARSARNVVDEIEYFQKKYGVNEFHFEDVNPTLNKKRIKEFCRLLNERNIRITWKLAQGTKLESLDSEAIDLMAGAGCNYVSMSPESGSKRILKLMNKPVDIDHAVEMFSLMNRKGIYTQACFVLGYPGENDPDRQQTAGLVRQLAKVGVDEVALFIITPMPGSQIYQQYLNKFQDLNQLTFTPKWRDDYSTVAKFRKSIYIQYIFIKMFYHPVRMFGYGWALLSRRFKTKVEMTLFRKIKVAWLAKNYKRSANKLASC